MPKKIHCYTRSSNHPREQGTMTLEHQREIIERALPSLFPSGVPDRIWYADTTCGGLQESSMTRRNDGNDLCVSIQPADVVIVTDWSRISRVRSELLGFLLHLAAHETSLCVLSRGRMVMWIDRPTIEMVVTMNDTIGHDRRPIATE